MIESLAIVENTENKLNEVKRELNYIPEKNVALQKI